MLKFSGGFYNLSITENLRLVVLNTNLNHKSDKVTEGDPDPGNQFQWLEAQLEEAVQNQEKVRSDKTQGGGLW